MVEWANPWAFPLLLLVAALPWQPRWTGVARLTVPGPAAYEVGWSLRRAVAHLPLALRMVGLALIVLALARPRLSHRTTVIESDGLDIMLAVDTSGSMKAQDFEVNGQSADRLSVAKGVMAEFIEQRPYDRLGVIVFGEEAFTHVPLTLDHDTLQSVLRSVQIGMAGEARTAVGQAIAVGAKRLKELEAPEKVLILLTDGQSNAGRFSPLEAAELAAEVGVKVYTIGIGAPPSRAAGMFNLLRGGGDGIDEPTLKAVAERTGGAYYRAASTRALRQIYDTINQLEPSPAEIEEVVHHEELYRSLLAPGVLLMIAQALLGATWLRRSP